MPFKRDRLGWAQLAQREEEARQQAWERSPEYLDQMLRTRQGVQNVQAGLEQRDPSGVFARQRAQKLAAAQEAGEQERQNIQLKAKLDAENFELRYTAKDKAEIASLRNQQRKAQALFQSGEITEEEYRKAVNIFKNKEMGITPGMLPSLSPYPKGQGVGDTWRNAANVWVRRNKDGEEIPIDWSKTEAGMAQEHEVKAATKKAELDNKEREGRQKLVHEMLKEEVYDEKTKTTRRRSPAEIRERLELVYPSTPAPDPAEVRHAQEYIDQMEARWGSNPPPDVVSAMRRAGALIEAANKRVY